jgi:hypothetical protein
LFIYFNLIHIKFITNSYLFDTVFYILLLFSAIYIADFIAGFVHFLGDIIQDYHFIYHHKDPQYICTKSYVHHTINSYYLAIPIYITIHLFLGNYRLIFLWLQIVTLMATQGNEFHHYVHCQQKEIGPIIKFLQRHNLFISSWSHRNHHKPPYNKDFCTVTGWANTMLNKITVPISKTKFIKVKYPPKNPPTKLTYDPYL